MRVALFSKFYEELLRQYFNHNSYKVCEGKPRIFWKKITVPSEARGSNHLKLINSLKTKQRKESYCIPDGLFVKDEKYFVWEAKNWVQELYPSPFDKYVWSFPWLLAKKVEYKSEIHNLSGFVISWWEREVGMEEALIELRKQISPATVDLVITKEVLQECIITKPEWYINLIQTKQNNIADFFDILLGNSNLNNNYYK